LVYLTALWLPILLSAVAAFVASSILHMVLKYHQSDYRAMPGEDSVLDTMRSSKVTPGHYYLPHCVDMKELGKPEVKAKFDRGPVAFVTVLPNGLPAMGKALVAWFVLCLTISVFVGYLTGRALAPGTEYLPVFRIAGTAAFLGYAGCAASESIWKGQPWSTTAKHVFDGLVYSLLTGGVFGWLWPA